jgi:hypothetical protein
LLPQAIRGCIAPMAGKLLV